MDDVTIKVENLGKRYRIGQPVGYKTLRESLSNAFAAPWRRLHPSNTIQASSKHNQQSDYIWALKNVSFKVKRGEVVGIIGRNGSGKSTLLKILSRITSPDEGYAEIRGHVGSLLEVGTGFHPELTGRENIYLNGAILGLKRAQIKRKFDEIVAFSEIERFLDTPVKRYSSGMYVRLAFAVAAHLEPDILLVDEVLAVGDAQFQKKCLGKMGDVAKEGRTVLFVSHNMAAVQTLCRWGILLDKGHTVAAGKVEEVVGSYLAQQTRSSDADIDLTEPTLRQNSLEKSIFKWKHLQIVNSQGKPSASIRLLEPFELILMGVLTAPVNELVLGFGITSLLGFPVFNSHTTDTNLSDTYPAGEVTLKIKFDPNIIAAGMYMIDVGAIGPGVNDWIPEAVLLNIQPISPDGSVTLRSNFSGVVIYPCKWSLEESRPL